MSGRATSQLANIKSELQQVIDDLSNLEASVRTCSVGVSGAKCADSINETKKYIADIKQRVNSLSAVAAAKDASDEEGGSFGGGGGGGGIW